MAVKADGRNAQSATVVFTCLDALASGINNGIAAKRAIKCWPLWARQKGGGIQALQCMILLNLLGVVKELL